jgi:hypothetical protein
MAEKEIIPFRVNLNKLPPREDSLAIVLVEEPLPLTIIPPKKVVAVSPRSYKQAYYAQVCQPTLPPPQDHLLLKDALKGSKISILKDV